MTPADLPFPFYAFPNTASIGDTPLAFAYHVVINTDVNRAICNDIPCTICPFSCKQGHDRTAVLTTFARQHYPELLV